MEHLFHVHTYRCGHAGSTRELAYVERAVELGAKKITFTDHAPFPGDPFHGRMPMSDLEDYIGTLTDLQEKFRGKILIEIGLETEYFPEYEEYYRELKRKKGLDLLLLGQHMYGLGDGRYSFLESEEVLNIQEAPGLANAVVQGIESGFFDAVAHPDRCFRKRREWSPELEELSIRIINSAVKADIPLEINRSSQRSRFFFWPEFWELAERCGAGTICGLDAHNLEELEG